MKRTTARFSSDLWLALSLFLVLASITIAAAIRKNQANSQPVLSVDSVGPQGGRALALWTSRLGFPVIQEDNLVGTPASRVVLAFELEPLLPIQASDWKDLDRWVEAGGTLILGGSQPDQPRLPGIMISNLPTCLLRRQFLPLKPLYWTGRR